MFIREFPPLRDLSSGEPHGSRMYSGFADFCIRTRNISSENRVGIFILGIMSGVSEIIPTSHSDTVDTVFLPRHAEYVKYVNNVRLTERDIGTALPPRHVRRLTGSPARDPYRGF